MHTDSFKVYYGGKSYSDKWEKIQQNSKLKAQNRVIINIDGISNIGKTTIIGELLKLDEYNFKKILSLSKDKQKEISKYSDKQIQSDIVWEHRIQNLKNINEDTLLKFKNILIDRSLLSTMTYQNNSIEYVDFILNKNKKNIVAPNIFVLLYTDDVSLLKDRIIMRDGKNIKGLDKIENPNNLNTITEYLQTLEEFNTMFLKSFNQIQKLDFFKHTKFLKFNTTILSKKEILSMIIETLQTFKTTDK